MPDPILILTTAPRLLAARKIAKVLLDQKLAACIHIGPFGESHYHWQGKRERSRECLLIIKAPRKHYSRIEHAIKSCHPYEVPEIISILIDQGSTDYLSWLTQSTCQAQIRKKRGKAS